MAEKIKVIVKRPDEKYGHVTRINNTLEAFQKAVDGPIETVRITSDVILIVNEEGKLRDLPKNFRLGRSLFADVIVGNAVVVGDGGDEFMDCPIDFNIWQHLIDGWN